LCSYTYNYVHTQVVKCDLRQGEFVEITCESICGNNGTSQYTYPFEVEALKNYLAELCTYEMDRQLKIYANSEWIFKATLCGNL